MCFPHLNRLGAHSNCAKCYTLLHWAEYEQHFFKFRHVFTFYLIEVTLNLKVIRYWSIEDIKATTSGPHQFYLHCQISHCRLILVACSIAKVYIAQKLRGRPLMIWGGPEENSKRKIFFPTTASVNFFFPEKDYQKIFFPGEGPSKNFLSQRRATKKKFFPHRRAFNFFSLGSPFQKKISPSKKWVAILPPSDH